MEDLSDSTVIIKSLKELRSFIGTNKESSSNIFAGYSSSSSGNSSKSDLMQEKMTAKTYDSKGQMTPGNSFALEHKNNVVGLDVLKQLREKNREINSAKTKIALLEMKIDTMHTKYTENSIKHEAELEDLRRIKLEKKETIDNLERKIVLLKKKETEVKNSFFEKNEKLQEENLSLQNHVTGASQQYLLEKESFLEEIDTLRKKCELSRKALQEKDLELFSLQSQVKGLEEDLADSQKQNRSTMEDSIESSRLKQELLRKDTEIADLKHRLDMLKDHEKKLESFEESAKKLYLLESEVFKLKQENSNFRKAAINTCIIEENLSSAKKQLNFLETRCSNLSEENGILLSIKDQFKQYEDVIKDELKLMCLPSVDQFRDQLTSLCSRDTELQKTIDTLKSGVESHETTRKKLQDTVAELEAQVKRRNENLEKLTQHIRRLQRKTSLVSKERDSLKGIIASYESEATMNPTEMENQKIKKLEEQLEAYKSEITKLEKDLEQNTSTISQQFPKNLASHPKTVPELEEVIEKLTEEKDALEYCIATQIPHGHFDPITTRVLTFKDNPLYRKHSDRSKEMQRLQKDNDALQCRIRLMEEGENADLTQKVSVKVDTLNPRYVQELENKVKQQEQSHEKLQKAFGKNLKMFREAVLKLTGYRFDCDNKIWKLFHAYMEDRSDHLCLQKDNEGNFQLLETEFSSRLGPLIDEYLQQDDSYPAFLAAVTMELFHKHAPSEEDEDEDEDDDNRTQDDEEQSQEEPPTKRPRVSEDDDLICLD